MSEFDLDKIVAGLKSGDIIPYLGPGALQGSVNKESGEPIPADSDSLIFAINNGRPMAPKLMFEFPRAAMNLELKKGRSYINKTLNKIYGQTEWTRAPLHDWLATLKPAYVIDINRDTQLQDSYADAPHLLVRGIARVGGTEFRYRVHLWDGTAYKEIPQEDAPEGLPILYKPMGTPRPSDDTFIASDADYVDFITELMGGFAIPSFLKSYRQNRTYLFLGMHFTRDTERMVMADITYGVPEGNRGIALIKDPSDKELRYCKKMNITVVREDIDALIKSVEAA